MLTYYYGHCTLAFKRQLNYNYPTEEENKRLDYDWGCIQFSPLRRTFFCLNLFPREAIKKIRRSVSMMVEEEKVGIILGIDNCKRDPSSSLFTLINLLSLYFLQSFQLPK